MPTVKVIRIIQYEGTEEAVRKAIQLSKSLGVHQYSGYQMTVAEHLNELPQLVELMDTQIENDLKRSNSSMSERSTKTTGPFVYAMIENRAIELYDSWHEMDGWIPWVIAGNSLMQDEARRVARKELKL